MARRDSNAVVQAHYVPSYTVVDEWEGCTAGDIVKVTGERGDFTFRNAHFKDGAFIAVIVHGGVHGHQTVRAFRPERCKKVNKRKKRETASE